MIDKYTVNCREKSHRRLISFLSESSIAYSSSARIGFAPRLTDSAQAFPSFLSSPGDSRQNPPLYKTRSSEVGRLRSCAWSLDDNEAIGVGLWGLVSHGVSEAPVVLDPHGPAG